MKIKQYSEYQSSDKIWVGEIPGHWNLKKLRRVVHRFVDYRGRTPSKVENGVPLITAKNIKNGHINFSISKEYMNEDDYEKWMMRGYPEIGDVLVTTEAPLGETAQVSDTNIALAQRIILLKADKKIILNEYLKYFIFSKAGQGELWSRATGSTALGIKADRLKGITVTIPPIQEQQEIASFLDLETNRIDTLISKKERQIELLKERIAALISNAVTKGFDSNVKIKDSGVEWLGKIPDHWRVIRLRFVALINPVKSEVSNLPPDTEVSFIPMEAVSEFGGLLLDQTRAIEEVYNGYTYFRNGDIVIAKITPCFENGKGSIAEKLTNGVGFGTTELHVVRPGIELDHRFFFYLSISTPFRQPGKAEMYGAGGQKRVPDLFVRNYRIPLPPITEQQQIVRQIDAEWKRIGDLTKEIQESIILLHEYRTALISAAVTGKINVINAI